MEKEKLKKNPITVLDNRKSRNNRVFFLYYFIIHGYLALLFILLALYKTSAF